jgi:aminoglycoside 6'-N-acetyltransferase I
VTKSWKVLSVSRKQFRHWAEMRHQLWPHLSVRAHLKELATFTKSRKFKGWILFDNNLPIAFAEVYLRPYVNGCEGMPVPFVEGIWVHQTYRGRGAGHRLIRTISDWARKHGYKELGSDAELHNKISHKCHRKWGFKETERVIYFRKVVK